MNHEFSEPHSHEVAKIGQPLTPDSLEPDTRLAVGTRKLIAVMFFLLRMPPIPSQEIIDAHIAEVAKTYPSDTTM